MRDRLLHHFKQNPRELSLGSEGNRGSKEGLEFSARPDLFRLLPDHGVIELDQKKTAGETLNRRASARIWRAFRSRLPLSSSDTTPCEPISVNSD